MKPSVLLLTIVHMILGLSLSEQNGNSSSYQETLKEYLSNPAKFIVNHSNEDNFVAVFSNFTKTDGKELLNSYLHELHYKDIQTLLDNMNNIKVKHVKSWKFDPVTKKYVLPDKMRSYSDYYKWQMIIAILKTVNNSDEGITGIKTTNLRGKHLVKFPYNLDIIDPPK